MKIPNASVQRILGEADPETQHYLTDEAAGLFQSLSHMLWRMNDKGYSFAHPLSVHDLRIVKAVPHYLTAGSQQSLFVKNFPIFVPRHGIRYLPASTESINRDHYCASLSLKAMLVHCYGENILDEIMDDFKDYFRSMQDSSFPKGYPTLVHPVFLPMEFRSEAFLDVYDLIEGRTLVKSIRDELLSLLPYQNEWDKIVTKNALLKKWYEFPQEGYDPIGFAELFSACVQTPMCLSVQD